VAHLLLLGAQVALEALMRRDFSRHALDHSDAGRLKRRHLLGIIRHQANLLDAEHLQRFGRKLVLAAVGGKAKLFVGLHRVQPTVLQFVGPELRHQPNPPALLLLIKQNARARRGDLAQSQLQLQAAIAAQRAEDVAGEALRVDAHQWRRGMNVTHDQRYQTLRLGRRFAARARLRAAFEAEDAEIAPARREIRFGDFLHTFRCHASIVGGGITASEILGLMDHASIPFEIAPAEGSAALEDVRKLMQEYWNSFGFTPCFQNFSEELAALPGRYAPPDGRLALAWAGSEAAGCIALRRLADDRAEIKRLYVRPAFRGRGLARSLMEWVIREARAAGYSELVGDTMPLMGEALALYDRMGFKRTEPYSDQDASGAIPIRLKL
jgi:putative acetyltransferase